jgi:RNA polymerase sigma-70 factor (ECF subfamily)
MRDDLPFPAAPTPAEARDAPDAALVLRLAAGDRPALEPLYRRHKGIVYRFALLWTGSPAAAADVTQDVFLHLLTRAGDFDAARGALPTWLLGIARNFARRRTSATEVSSVDDDVPDGAPTPDERLADRQGLDLLRRAIAALPPHYRDVLVLVELAERSYAEAALICGCELNTVRSRLARARAILTQRLALAGTTATAAHPHPRLAAATASTAPTRPRSHDDH